MTPELRDDAEALVWWSIIAVAWGMCASAILFAA
jgi:hypothetical protein